MNIQNSSIDSLLEKLRKEHPQKIVSDEDYKKAEKDINEKMRIFSLEHKAYMNQSIESAKHAYITF
jgi:hypothetical protein